MNTEEREKQESLQLEKWLGLSKLSIDDLRMRRAWAEARLKKAEGNVRYAKNEINLIDIAIRRIQR